MIDFLVGLVALLVAAAGLLKWGEKRGAAKRDETAQKAAKDREAKRDEIDDTASAGDAVDRLRREWSRDN